MASGEKVDLTHGQLVSLLSDLLDQKLANLATKDELEKVTGRVNDLTNENVLLKKEVAHLRRSERKNVERLINLEGRSRRNNVIFRGLKVSGTAPDYRDVVKQFCHQMFGSRMEMWVNRAHPLGRSGAIIAHLPDDNDIEHIMSQTRKLKNTGYVVHRDFPQEVRHSRTFLMRVRTEVERVAGRRRMPLAHDHVTIENIRFTWRDKLRAGQQDGAQKLQELFKHDFSAFLASLAAAQEQHEGHTQQPRDTDTLGVSGGGGRALAVGSSHQSLAD